MVQSASDITLSCPACGATARRAAARYCATCGRTLRDVDYLPTDTLRASYHQQQSHPPFKFSHMPHRTCIMRPQPRMTNMKVGRAQASDAAQLNGATKFNGATQLARAFVTYALVPYLGILFCPGAGLLGCLGLWRARREGRHANARAARRCIMLSLFIFSAQMFIWWLLYRV
jgi:predicted amidophosphoribosyltransferase